MVYRVYDPRDGTWHDPDEIVPDDEGAGGQPMTYGELAVDQADAVGVGNIHMDPEDEGDSWPGVDDDDSFDYSG